MSSHAHNSSDDETEKEDGVLEYFLVQLQMHALPMFGQLQMHMLRLRMPPVFGQLQLLHVLPGLSPVLQLPFMFRRIGTCMLHA